MHFKAIVLASDIKMSNFSHSVLLLLISLLILSSCALSEINKQAKTVENVGTIKGVIKVDST